MRGEEWRRIGLGQVGPGGSFSITHNFVVAGDSNIRVVVRPFRFNTRGASEPRSYEISQAQNPQLTIQSSANPLAYGQPATISGTLGAGTAAAVASTPVTLLARTRLQHKFAPVATGVTGAGGSYAFAAQTPQQSTFYRVTGAGKSSAVLFEGVKYVLTAAASATTAQAGQPVTFSGTVTHRDMPGTWSTCRCRTPQDSASTSCRWERSTRRPRPAAVDLLDQPRLLQRRREPEEGADQGSRRP